MSVDKSSRIVYKHQIGEIPKEIDINQKFSNNSSGTEILYNEHNELSLVNPPLTIEMTQPSMLQTIKSDAVDCLTELTTSLSVSYDLERKNGLEIHIEKTLVTLQVQLQSDPPIKKDLTTQYESTQSSSDFQCLESTNSIYIKFPPRCCRDLMGFLLAIENHEHLNDQHKSMENDTFKRFISIECVCLDFELSDLEITDHFSHKIQSFDDECLCISHLLSSEEKLIYFIVSLTAGKLVIPLIHNHRYIRQIYIYRDPDINLDTKWTEDFTKVHGVWSCVNTMTKQIKDDIQSYKTRPSRWTRHTNLLTELWAQSSKKSSLDITPLPKQKISDGITTLNIVMLYYNNYRPFRLCHHLIEINEFNEVENCRTFIQKCDSQSAIFLIICVNFIDFSKIVDFHREFDSIHAAYIFTNHSFTNKFQAILPDVDMKLSGIFNEFNDILVQLCKDICFYRELLLDIPKMTMLRSDVSRIEELNESEIEFIRFQLFIEIIPQLSDIVDSSNKTNLSDDLFSELIVNSDFGQIVNVLFHRCGLHTLLTASSLLNNISKQLNSLTLEKTKYPTAIYRTQVITREYLDMLRNNINNLLTIHTFILFSRSFPSTIDTCHRCINNGVTVVLLEIEISESTTIRRINSDTFACRLGSIFRLLSIDEMPDGIWHVQLKLMDYTMDYIKKQLLFEINARNTWLTFGNYMSALRLFEEAEVYYKYLLCNTQTNNPIHASIYNNMGLMYSTMGKQDQALDFFKKSSEAFVEGVSINAEEDHALSVIQQSISDSEFCPVTLYGKIAEGYNRKQEYDQAINYYQKALKFASDPGTKLFYQTAIKASHENLLKKNKH